jgi:hypothetical protein
LKTRDAYVRRKAAGILIWVMGPYSRWRTLSIEVQEPCGREAISYKCWKWLCGKFYADGFTWNLIMPCYQMIGLGELELQMKSGWSGLLALPTSLHVTSVELCKGTSACATSATGYWWTEVDNYQSYWKTDRNMLQRVWDELDYRLDIRQDTNGAQIEHL